MRAVIDIGTNTIRMLLGDCRNGILAPESYHRQITRLGGDFSPQNGLSVAAMDRSLATLQFYQDIIDAENISQVRTVATAALRSANNRDFFLAAVVVSTGIKIEVIAGEEEARLTTLGVLSVIDPIPKAAIVMDIGGGSTELICIVDGKIRAQKSYPVGVVGLCEGCTSAAQRQSSIDVVILQFSQCLQQIGMAEMPFQLIGTAGTITTLAAIHLQLKKYNHDLINNHVLSIDWLHQLQQELEVIPVSQRELMVGMETGRGDLILPGLQILLTVMQQFQFSTVKVSDCGLLEGLMLQLTEP